MPSYSYLKLFLTALHKLPTYQGIIWRDIPHGLTTNYRRQDEQAWLAFSSDTSSLNIFKLATSLGAHGDRTLFNIEEFDGRLISEFSEFNDEDEILLLPGTYVRVVGEMRQSDGLHIVQLKQKVPPYFPFQPPEQTERATNYTSRSNKKQKLIGDARQSKEYQYYEDNYESQSVVTDDSLSTFNTQLQLATNISSDSEKAQVLKHLLANKNLSDDMIAGVVECIGTMYAPREKGDLLQLIAKRPGLTQKQFRMSVEGINDISADNQKATTLKAFLVHEQFTVHQHLDVVLSAVGSMYASADKLSVFTDLIRNRYLNAKHFPSILDGIKDMSSDAHKSSMLCKLAPRLPKHDAHVREAYLEAADSIYSSKEKAAATMVFM